MKQGPGLCWCAVLRGMELFRTSSLSVAEVRQVGRKGQYSRQVGGQAQQVLHCQLGLSWPSVRDVASHTSQGLEVATVLTTAFSLACGMWLSPLGCFQQRERLGNLMGLPSLYGLVLVAGPTDKRRRTFA